MNRNKLEELTIGLRDLLKNFSFPDKKELRKHLKLIELNKYTTNSMIDLECFLQEITKKERDKNKETNSELLKKLLEIFNIVKNPEDWCL